MHMLQHTKLESSCSVCGISFATHSKLRSHTWIHRAGKPHSCTFCIKQFYTKSEMERHMLKHTGFKPYSCSVCHKGVVSSSSLKRHMRLHSFHASQFLSFLIVGCICSIPVSVKVAHNELVT